MRTGHLAAVMATAAVLLPVVLLAGCATATSNAAAGNPPLATTSSPGQPTPPATTTAPPTTTALSTTNAPSTSPTTVIVATDGQVDRTEPTAVAEALLSATFTSNTTTDTSPQDAVNRSLPWYTTAEAAAIRAEEPSGPPGAQWIAWTAHHAITSVAVTVDHDPGAPADTATAAYRQFTVTVTPHGSHGWTTPPNQYECFVVLTRPAPNGAWRVSSLNTDQ